MPDSKGANSKPEAKSWRWYYSIACYVNNADRVEVPIGATDMYLPLGVVASN